MKKISGLLNKYRHLLVMLAILAVSAVVLGWVAYDTLPLASTKSERTIVNDDYSTITDSIVDEEGIKQKIFVKKNTRLYGVSANFHTYNRVCFGIVHADLLDNTGNIVATAQRDMTTLLDNTFKGFIFDKMIQPPQDTEYTLHIWTQPQSSDDKIALWRSETAYDGFEMAVNGQQADGTLALQYITRHVGNNIYGWYKIFAAMVVIGLELLYLLVFVLKAKEHTIFAVSALLIGMIFSWFTPVNGGPDEYVHVASAYRISNEMLGWENSDQWGKLIVRDCDAGVARENFVEYSAFNFADMYDGLVNIGGGDTQGQAVIDTRFADVFRPMYNAQALGITVARVLKLGFIPMILMGRFFNLLQYVILVYFAVKLIPVYKTTLALIAVMPMCMQIAGNFAYDAYVIAMAFLFIALIFRLAYGKEKIEYKNLILPVIVLCMLAPAKTIYILMGLLVFMLPGDKFPDKKKAGFVKVAMLALAVVFWAVTNLSSVIRTFMPHDTAPANTVTESTVTVEETTEIPVLQPADAERLYPFEIFMAENVQPEEPVYWDPDSDILPNGDSRFYYSLPYILKNIKATVKLVMRTITTHTGKYLQTVVGTRLGEIILVDLQASWIWFIAIIVLLYLSVVPVKGTKQLHTPLNRLLGVMVFILVTGATVAACIMWTPINYETIFGIQGRYLIPALPLFITALGWKGIQLVKPVDKALLYTIVPVNIFVILNVFMIMTSR